MPAAHPHLFAVRDNLDLRDKEAHRLVAMAAIDDLANRARPSFRWTHTDIAQLLGVPQPFVSLVGNYLDYRRNLRKIGTEKGIRPYRSTCAQTFLYGEDDHPLDILNLGTSGDRTEQMAKMLMEATSRKVRVDPDAVHNIERMLGRFCGMAWQTVVDTVQRQQTARNDVINLSTTTAMGVKAA
jgi:predicted transcriptional regulator